MLLPRGDVSCIGCLLHGDCVCGMPCPIPSILPLLPQSIAAKSPHLLSSWADSGVTASNRPSYSIPEGKHESTRLAIREDTATRDDGQVLLPILYSVPYNERSSDDYMKSNSALPGG